MGRNEAFNEGELKVFVGLLNSLPDTVVIINQLTIGFFQICRVWYKVIFVVMV